MNVGDRFLDRYELTAVLGQGGFGRVFEAWDSRSRRTVAIKIDITGSRLALAEGSILAELQEGKGIPRLYTCGNTKQFSYIVMQCVGPSLASLLKTVGNKFTLGTTT